MSIGTNRPFSDLVRRARLGDEAARNEILSDCQDYLMFVARRDLDDRLRAKCAPSDMVQNALMNASSGMGDFRGDTIQSLKAWLREILRNEMAMASRHFLGTAKRDVRREQVSKTDSQFWLQRRQIKDRMVTPSTEAVLQEDAAELRAAMVRLPDDYRSVLIMRNWERLSFKQIAVRLERSENAAKKLWARALSRLETELFSADEQG
jgi:RNA polymerase sigma-70 factor (ECF subfamily)